METNKEYFAFISYQRQDEDWAKWLADQLEHYHLPLTLNGRKDLRPIFRDIDELAAGNLPQQIHQALKNSKNLIVVCSPNSAKSPWVNKEVETFIGMGKLDNIFPLIIDGVPFSKNEDEECLPEALRNLSDDRERLGANVKEYKDGPQRLCKDCPLPKDNRDNKKQGDISDKGPNAAVVKIIAGMLGLHFDTLWQRYEKEKIEEERRIKEQRDNLLRVQSRFISEKVNDLVDDNNAFLGTLLVLESLPINLYQPDRPYVHEAEFALRKACAKQSAVLLGHEGGCLFASFSPDGKHIISGAADHTAKIWDTTDGRLLFSLQHTEDVSCAFFDKEGRYIVTSYEWNNSFCIWDAHTHQLVRTVNGHEKGVTSAVFSIDGQWIITASNDNTIRKWSVENGQEVLTIRGGNNGFRWASPSPDGNYIVSSGYDSVVRLWNSNTGEQMTELCKGIFEHPFAEYSPDGRFIGVAIGSRVMIWDAENLNLLMDMKVSQYGVNMLAFSPNGQKLAVANEDKTVAVWRLRLNGQTKKLEGEQIHCFVGHLLGIYSCRFSPNGKHLITASYDQSIRLWDIDEHLVMESEQGQGLICRAEFSPKGKLIAVVYNNNLIRLYDTSNWKLKGVIDGHTDYPQTLHFDSSGKRLVTTAADKAICVWDVERNTLLHSFKLFDNKASEARFSPNGKILVFSAWKHLFAYNTKDWSLLYTIDINGSFGIQYISFSPDGNQFVTSQAASVLIYETHTGNLLRSVNVYPRSAEKVRFDTMGKYVYFIDNISLCRMDTNTYSKVEVFEGHSDSVQEYAFSSDMLYVATASQDKTVRIWDLITRKALHVCKGHTWGVSSVFFHPDGHTIFSASFDGTIRQWSFQPFQELIDQTRERFKNHQLTLEERKKYYLD